MFDSSMLLKLLQASPEQVGNLASMAAMKAPPPVLPNPGAAGTLAPGAFAGILDPNVGAVPQGVQNPMITVQNAAPVAATPAGMPFGLDANQAGILTNLSQQQPLHFPGAHLAPRPGQIQTQAMGVPQVNAQRPSLAQLLGG